MLNYPPYSELSHKAATESLIKSDAVKDIYWEIIYTMISVLITKIITLFLIMVMGIALVKMKITKEQDVEGLARITLYLIIPCVVLRAFDTELTAEVGKGMIFSMALAIAIHLFFFVLIPVMRKFFRFNEVEILSVIYPNAGNLSIPLVSATLGWNYVIYTSSYIVVQQFLMWSHGRIVMQGERTIDWKKLFLNINIIVILLGFLLLLLQYHFPKPVLDAIDSVSDMVGPVTMLICGILLAKTNISRITIYRKWWQVILLRLIVVPLILTVIFKYSGIADLVSNGKNLLLVILFSVTTPPATTLTLMAEVYHRDSVYSNLLNVVATVLFLVTMPIILAFYLN